VWLITTAAAGLLTLATSGTATGCFGRYCEGDVKTFGLNENEGRMVDSTTWESTPLDGRWLDFPRARTWIFNLKRFVGPDGVPHVIVPYVSNSATPIASNASFRIGASGLVDISGVRNGEVVIRNGTCDDYFVRLVVQPAAPVSLSGDASDAPDSSVASDASDASQGGGDASTQTADAELAKRTTDSTNETPPNVFYTN